MRGAVNKAHTYNINKAHVLPGQTNENDTKQIASHLAWTITKGSQGVSESCANAKAR
jgi:hypothetical protein